MPQTGGIDESYERIAQIGEGTYGKVYKARDRKTDQLVALKKIRMESEKEGFPVTAAREIKLLKSMNHENIVKLLCICASSAASVHLVFEYVEYDLAGLLQYPVYFGISQIKCIMKQLLLAVKYLHDHGVVHRDLKGSNVLLGRDGRIKLADFGLAKAWYNPDLPDGNSSRMMTNRVITLWYRPPEVLLGATEYGPEVDMWSLGCIMLDLLNGRPVFCGQDELGQIENIVNKLGPLPTDSLGKYPWFKLTSCFLTQDATSPSSPASNDYLSEEFGDKLGVDGLDLLRSLLAMNPKQRITAKDALLHRWFESEPLPCDSIALMPNLEGDLHEFECKQRNRRNKGGALLKDVVVSSSSKKEHAT